MGPARRESPWKKASPAERILLLIASLSFLGMAALSAFMAYVSDEVGQTIEEDLKNRSVACRVLLGQGQHLRQRGPCLAESVLDFYDPWTVCEQLNKTRDVGCSVEPLRSR